MLISSASIGIVQLEYLEYRGGYFVDIKQSQ